jgi:hypothetical protein
MHFGHPPVVAHDTSGIDSGEATEGFFEFSVVHGTRVATACTERANLPRALGAVERQC